MSAAGGTCSDASDVSEGNTPAAAEFLLRWADDVGDGSAPRFRDMIASLLEGLGLGGLRGVESPSADLFVDPAGVWNGGDGGWTPVVAPCWLGKSLGFTCD